MTTQHTPGKLVHCKLGYPHADITAANGRRVAITWGIASNQPRTKAAADKRNAESRENARRLVACWNACEGIETEALEGHALQVIAAERAQKMHDMAAERDELLTWLRWAAKLLPEDVRSSWQYEQAQAAIAKVEGAA